MGAQLQAAVVGDAERRLAQGLPGQAFTIPLEARQEKRVVLSYAQRLPSLHGQAHYRFPAGQSLDAVGEWSLHARVKDGAGYAWASPSHPLKATKDGADLPLADGREQAAKAGAVLAAAARAAEVLVEDLDVGEAELPGALGEGVLALLPLKVIAHLVMA